MKILILVIGQLKNKKYFSGFSLLELIVVISIISVLGIFVGISSNFLNLSNNNISIEKKLNSIQEEIEFLKKYSLSLNASIELFSADGEKNSKIYFDKKNFNNCEIQNIKSKKIYISPSGEVTEFSLDCLIKNELVKIKINSSGRPASKMVSKPSLW